ncbi:MAG: TauD/TfdA family dioxygenase [Hyphomicrobium sp.]
MDQLRYEELHPQFGVSLRGVDLGKPLTPGLIQEINAAIDRYSFVCFPDQSMDDDRQLALTRQLGRPEPSHTSVGQLEYFGTIGNVQKDGTVLAARTRKPFSSPGTTCGTRMLRSNRCRRSSRSCAPTKHRPRAAQRCSSPCVPPTIASPPQRKAELDPLITIHDYVYSRSKVAPRCRIARAGGLAATCPSAARPDQSDDGRQEPLPRLPRPEIEGMSPAAGRALIDELTEEAIQPENIYAHAWQPGDVVLWDNRCLLHAGSGYDADRHRRYMRQTRVSGTCPTLEEVG